MILLIVPLFLILMILVIFYVFDLHLSIKSTSKSVDSNLDSQKDQDSSSSSSLIGDLSDTNIFSDLISDSETGVSPDVTPLTDILTDVSGVTENDLLDESTIPNTSSGYNIDDITALLNQVAVNTNVGVNVSDPSGTDATSQQEITARVSVLENAINNYLNSHTHDVSKLNNIYKKGDDIKLCDFSGARTPMCDDEESCAIMCSNDPNCAGWVYDISDSYRYTCDNDLVIAEGLKTISGGCVNIIGTCDDSLTAGEWITFGKEDLRSHTYITTDPPPAMTDLS